MPLFLFSLKMTKSQKVRHYRQNAFFLELAFIVTYYLSTSFDTMLRITQDDKNTFCDLVKNNK
jgi:hypothetical protein